MTTITSVQEIEDIEESVAPTTALVRPTNRTPLAAIISAADLKVRLDEETEMRKLVRSFIEDHLVENFDYGTIEMKTGSGKIYTTKPTLFKPGADKFMSLFHFFADYKPDEEIRELFHNKDGLICLKCFIYNSVGNLVSEGAGACDTSAEGKTQNVAIKIARKRAKMDAISNSGILSDFFSIMQEKRYGKPEESQPTTTVAGSTKCQHCGATGVYHSPTCPANPNKVVKAPDQTEDTRTIEPGTEDKIDVDSLPI